jgi:AcrR family transcriptional regulator
VGELGRTEAQGARDAAKSANRARILEAAGRTFAERGFDAGSVLDIARSAGMSAGNLYWHFASKEAILQAILADGFAAREVMDAAVADEYGPARRKLEILVDRTLAFHEEHVPFVVIHARLGGRGGAERLAALGFDGDELESRHRAHVRRVLAEARSEGAIVPGEPDVLVELVAAFLDGLALAGPEWRASLPREVLRDATLRLVGYRPAG